MLEYRDQPGDSTHDHDHPDSVMVTLSGFRRSINAGGKAVKVDMPPHEARWLDAQTHRGENTGESETHVIFVELKESAPDARESRLGPQES